MFHVRSSITEFKKPEYLKLTGNVDENFKLIKRKNEIIEHNTFFMRKQDSSETFDKLYADLKNLIKNCDFGKTENKLLRTQIVLGIIDKDLQGKLLREDLDFNEVVRHYQPTKQAEIYRKFLVQENKTKIDQGKKQQRENVSEQYSREHSKKTSKEKSNVKT